MDRKELQRREIIADLRKIRWRQRGQNAPIGRRPNNRPTRGWPLCWSKGAQWWASNRGWHVGIDELGDQWALLLL